MDYKIAEMVKVEMVWACDMCELFKEFMKTELREIVSKKQ